MKKILALISAGVFALIALSCGSARGGEAAVEGDTLTTQTQLLTLIATPQFTLADIRDPWHDNQLLARYALYDRTQPQPASIPDDAIAIPVPIANALVYSGVYGGLLAELGAADAIGGVCDASYFGVPEVEDLIAMGKIVDCGNSMSPSIERVVALQPEAILVSPFQNAGHGAIESLAIPIVECADYMESTPLARAEWIKLFARLVGRAELGDSIYKSVAQRYDELCREAAACTSRPMVVTEQVTDGVWYQPGGDSYMARLIADAGADYPWADDKSTGSLPLDITSVYARAHDADVWIMRVAEPIDLQDLASSHSLYREFKAFREGNVYACNTLAVPLYREFPFHPDLLLEEYIKIFHPEMARSGNDMLRYYKRLAP